jgi:voltage-gated potassium channel
LLGPPEGVEYETARPRVEEPPVERELASAAKGASLRARVYRQLTGEAWNKPGLSPINKVIVGFVLLSIVWIVLETENAVYAPFSGTFDAVDALIAAVFSAEYVARLWAVGEDPRYRGLRGRLRYVLTIWALIDLAAIVPFFLTFGANESFLLRLMRLFRVLAIGRLGRYSRALSDFGTALARRRYDLYVALAISMSIMMVAATGMYLIEGRAQPAAFGSIPRALWWSVTAFTPMAGGVVPQTVAGKVFAALSALAGIGLVAMPTAILAAAFGEVFRKRRGE